MSFLINSLRQQRRYIFGVTTAIITNLGLIAGLYFSANAKVNIIGSILVIAVADNISDSLGIHIYQETENMSTKEVWLSTFTNFMARFLVSLFFISIVIIFPLSSATIYLMILGIFLLGVISYIIARGKKINPYRAIAEHIVIAVIVIIVSRYLGFWIAQKF